MDLGACMLTRRSRDIEFSQLVATITSVDMHARQSVRANVCANGSLWLVQDALGGGTIKDIVIVHEEQGLFRGCPPGVQHSSEKQKPRPW